jgi:hypothetical protein
VRQTGSNPMAGGAPGALAIFLRNSFSTRQFRPAKHLRDFRKTMHSDIAATH